MRELRQDASALVRRAEGGEEIVVTAEGRAERAVLDTRNPDDFIGLDGLVEVRQA